MFIRHLSAEWPSTSSSQLHILGLFGDPENTFRPTPDSVHPRAMFKAAVTLAQRYNITVGGHSIGWKTVQTGGNVVNALRDSCLKISSSNIVGIVGPALSRESHVIAPFAKTIGIPVISYSATDPDLSDRSEYPAFFRTTPSDDTAALAIVKLFIDYNWTSCVIIYQNDAFGTGGMKVITAAFQNRGLSVANPIMFDIAMNSTRGDLKSQLLRSSTRIVLLWTQAIYAEMILQNAIRNRVLGPQFLWILSSTISLEKFDRSAHSQLVGLLTIQATIGSAVNALVNTTLLNEAFDLWQQYEPESFSEPDKLDYDALFAFDAAWTLIQALQKFCSTTIGNSSSCISLKNSSFCFDRQLHHGELVYEIIHNNTFLGVSGWIEFGSNVTDRINGTYYIARNIQRSLDSLKYLPIAVWSNLTGWYPYASTSVIVWPGNTLTRPTGYAAISGLVLRIALVLSEPFASVTNITGPLGTITSKFIGYMPELVGLLQNKMGFIPNITVLPTNQSYNQMVDWIVEGLFDMVVADLTITASRREKAAFSASIFDNSLRIVIRKCPAFDIDLFAYLKPFSSKLWLALLITTIYAGLVFCFLERRENPALKNRPIPSLIALSMWYSIGTILGYGTDFQVRTAPGRLLTTGLYILCLISVAAYTANLASDLTISNTKYAVTGIENLRDGKIPFNRIGILIDTSIEDFYLREISDGIRNYYPLTSKQHMFDSLLSNRIDASIMDAGYLEYITENIYCNLTLVGGDFDRSSFGIAYPKRWQYAQQLDVAILSLTESGSLDSLKAKWFQGDACTQSSDNAIAVSISSMAGLIFTFGVFAILSLILFIWINRPLLKKYFIIVVRSVELLAKERFFFRQRRKDDTGDQVSDSKLSSSPMVNFNSCK